MSQELILSQPKDLLAFLGKSKTAIEMALPKHLNADRMMRLALTCFSTTPKLRECTAQSILASVVVASQCGLEIGVRGQAYLIPYKKTATFVPGWQGLVGLLNNTGRATAWTGAVFEGDEWDFQLGSNPKCRHIPGENYGDIDKLIWVYACGKVNGSEQPVIEAWPISRVKSHRDRYNRVGSLHYSYDNLEMYARKVVLLQVLKYMPTSIELNNAIVANDASEMGKPTVVDNGVVIEAESTKEPDFDEPTMGEAGKPQPPENSQKAPAIKAPASSTTTNAPAKQAEFAPGGVETADVQGITPELNQLGELMLEAGITEAQVVKFCHETPGFLTADQTSLKDLPAAKCAKLVKSWPNIKDRVKALQIAPA